jgi:DNA-binding MarR family transcriptional regulator
MNNALAPEIDRTRRIDYVSTELLQWAALVTRLLVRQLGDELSRTQVGVLGALSSGPRRITELADLEGLAQPTMTILVKQLEQRGWLRRERQRDDGRVVLVHLNEAGEAALEDFRARARVVLGAHLAELPNQQVEALASATETLARLAAVLQQTTAT